MLKLVRGTCRYALLAVLLSSPAFAQSIITVAGGGTVDGQLATDLPPTAARGIALDRTGSAYIVTPNRVIRVDAATARVKVVAGSGASGFSGDGGLAVNATFNDPRGIALDSSDNIYVTDNANDRVRRIDAATGIITTYAGGGSPETGLGDGGAASNAKLSRPWGLTIARGVMYITEANFDAHRVRRVDMATGVITRIAGRAEAGGGGFAGDGGPATEATLNSPTSVVVDASGNVYVGELDNHRVRRIDTNNIITTYAGGGPLDRDAANGQPATSAALSGEIPALALDRDGNLLIAANPDILKVDRASGTLTQLIAGVSLVYGFVVAGDGKILFSSDSQQTVIRTDPGDPNGQTFFGGGSYVGNGLPATAAVLSVPQGLAFDSAGNLLIADSSSNTVRRVATDGTITKFAGTTGSVYLNEPQDGIKATDAVIGFPRDVAVDAANNVYIADGLNGRVWVVSAADGTLRSYAGGGTPADGVGDNGPAAAAMIIPVGIALDRAGNLFIADYDGFANVQHRRVRRVDAQTKVITTVAGSATAGSSGDGGLATQALLSIPLDVAVDNEDNVFISDNGAGTIRRIDRGGTITKFAGSGTGESAPIGDNGPAVDARLAPLGIEVNRATGDVFVNDFSTHRTRRIDARTRTITTVAGSGTFYTEGDFGGDNGPATAARLHFFDQDAAGVAITPGGDVYIADSLNNRVRAVFACGAVAAPVLSSPADGAATSTAPLLAWSKANRAFRYDVLLDTVSPPVRVVANDVSSTSLATSNLLPSTKYFWRIVAKGDPFCTPVSTPSAIASFTTSGVCVAGPFNAAAPADGATVTAPAVLSWTASAGAATYDVYLGTSSPAPLFAAGLTGTTFTANVPNGRYSWFVVAHAACDPTETAATTVRSFDVAGGAVCTPGQLSVTNNAPINGATNTDTSLLLTWTTTGVASSFDVYFGTTADPPLLNSGVTALQQDVSGLLASTVYFWRVVAKGPCEPNGVSSAVTRFTTKSCSTPGEVNIVFAPATVSVGTTYTIVWSPASALDADGGYLVERSTSSSFTSDLVSQVVSTTAASFEADAVGTYFHRVRAVPGCDPSRLGPLSSVRAVSVVAARPNVVMTVQANAEIVALGERLVDHSGAFALENISNAPVQVILGRQEIGGSPPFFTIFDPQGGDSAFVTLQPRVPRMFEIRYSGPQTNTPASYQGVIFLAATGEGLSVTPYGFVNLKVGGTAAAAPQVTLDGTVVDYVAFPPFAGDDTSRPPLAITIRNPGSAPVDLGAEIGPEVWLVPENGWNSTPLAAGASRTVNLFTRRGQAPNGSPLPRYTYLTLRTKDGASTRVLVQDSDDVPVANARTIRLAPAERSIIVPEVVSRAGTVSTVRLSNVGNDRVQAELIFTPAGADGFGSDVRRATVVVPPNDVVTLTDPLSQIFRLARPQSGQVEIRIARERQGLIGVTSSIGTPGRSATITIPVSYRGDGARVGNSETIAGITTDPATIAALTLAETTGTDTASVRIRLVSAEGTTLGTTSFDLPRYGYRRFDNVVGAVGGTAVDGGRIEITVERGAGAVTSIAFVGNASVAGSSTSSTRTVTSLGLRMRGDATSPTLATVVPIITRSSGTRTSRTRLGFVAPANASASFTATYRNALGGAAITKQIPVPANATLNVRDFGALFGVANPTSGTVTVETPSGSKVYAVVESTSTSGGPAAPSAFLPLPTTLSEAVTTAAALGQRPLFLDGLDQSIDRSRGANWALLLNEVAGAGGTVTVRLYEAANRSVPIAQRDFTVGANQQLLLDTVFAEMSLDAPDRRKDRTNMLVTVIARGGTARVAATAIATDNTTGEVKAYALLPSMGGGTPGVSLVTPVLNAAPKTGRRRAVRP